MSNKTQLQTNNTQLASLIQTLQGKAAGGGGGGVETCTVTVNASNRGAIAYTKYSEGNIEACVYRMTVNDKSQNIVFTNVICSSALSYLSSNYFMMLATNINGEGALLDSDSNSAIFSTPSTSGATTVFKIYDDD